MSDAATKQKPATAAVEAERELLVDGVVGVEHEAGGLEEGDVGVGVALEGLGDLGDVGLAPDRERNIQVPHRLLGRGPGVGGQRDGGDALGLAFAPSPSPPTARPHLVSDTGRRSCHAESYTRSSFQVQEGKLRRISNSRTISRA